MIDLLTIQETSRTGFPPAAEAASGEADVERPFSDYLNEAESASPEEGTAAGERSVSAAENGEPTAGSEPENEAAGASRTTENGESVKKDRTASEKGEARNKRAVSREKEGKERTGESSGFSKNAGKTADTEGSTLLGKNGLKAGVEEESAPGVQASKISSGEAETVGKESGKKSKAEAATGTGKGISSEEELSLSAVGMEKILSPNEISEATAAGNGERLLDEVKNRGLEGREENLKSAASGSHGLSDSAALKTAALAAADKGDTRVKIELSDQRKNLKKNSSRDEVSRGTGLQIKSGAGVEASGSSAGTDETLAAGNSGSEGFDGTGAGEEGETPFRVVELGTSVAREGNIETLSVNKGELAGGFKSLLQEKGVPNIVKQTGILLKDNNQGEIRLILRPESLGKVRIRLNLDENNIAGRIFVENINVKDAFNSTLEDLQRALRDAGFDAANLEVFVQGEGAGGSRENSEDRDDEPVMVHPSVIETIEESIPLADSAAGGMDARVNLLA